MKPLFIVGSPRSGTTWLQLLLAQFAPVATSQETHLFSRYLGPVRSAWEDSRRGATGLHNVVDDTEFLEWCRTIAVRTLESILSKKEGANIPLEKTPGHVFHMLEIDELLPGSRFLHIIRDPRAVTSSLLRVGESWGGDWAPQTTRGAVCVWRRHVEAGRRAADALGEEYREVRYEDLCYDPVDELRPVLRWIGVEASRDECRRAVRACDFNRINEEGAQHAAADEVNIRPGKGADARTSRVDAWRRELSRTDVSVVEWEAGELMLDLGYPLLRDRRRKPAKLTVRDAFRSACDVATSAVRALAGRTGRS